MFKDLICLLKDLNCLLYDPKRGPPASARTAANIVINISKYVISVYIVTFVFAITKSFEKGAACSGPHCSWSSQDSRPGSVRSCVRTLQTCGCVERTCGALGASCCTIPDGVTSFVVPPP